MGAVATSAGNGEQDEEKQVDEKLSRQEEAKGQEEEASLVAEDVPTEQLSFLSWFRSSPSQPACPEPSDALLAVNGGRSKPLDVLELVVLLKKLEHAIDKGDCSAATTCNDKLSKLTAGFGPWESIPLDDPEGDEEYGILQERQHLKARWSAFRLHGGSWTRLCNTFQGSGVLDGSADPPAAAPERKDELLEAAKDLSYSKPPTKEHRRSLWLFCAGLGTSSSSTSNAGVLPSPPKLTDDGNQPDKVMQEELEQIRLDALRTPFLKPNQREALVRVLFAHCRKRREATGDSTHYVQGMHMLVACTLWVGFSETQALEVFEFVLDNLCKGYYTETDFRSFLRDVHVMELLIQEHLPYLSTALQAAGLPIQLVSFDPLLGLFTHHAKGDVAARFWDMIFLEGDEAIFAIHITLLARLLPERDTRGREDASFAERLHEGIAKLSPKEVEEVMRVALHMLQDPGFRDKVKLLRAEATTPAASDWSWSEAVVGVLTGWWPSSAGLSGGPSDVEATSTAPAQSDEG